MEGLHGSPEFRIVDIHLLAIDDVLARGGLDVDQASGSVANGRHHLAWQGADLVSVIPSHPLLEEILEFKL